MCIFKVSYIGKSEVKGSNLKFGCLYGVEKVVTDEVGKDFLVLEGIDGKYDKKNFHKLENKGFHYLNGDTIPKIGSCMRLVKRKSDTNEFMTGEVKEIEKTSLSGIYRVYTEKCIYEVTSII